MKKILKSYFYWTYARGSFHYDVLVTLILLFVFITPHLWNYGDTASSAIGIQHPIQVVGNERGRRRCGSGSAHHRFQGADQEGSA